MASPINMEISQAKINVGTLASILGITERRTISLANEKIIRSQSQKPFRFILETAVQDYIDYKAQGGTEEGLADEERIKKAEAEIKENRAIKERLITATLQGKMHDARDVKNFTSQLVLAFRQGALALPNQLALPTAKANDPAITHQLVKEKVNELLDELMKYDYEKEAYVRCARERLAIAQDQPEEFLDDEETAV